MKLIFNRFLGTLPQVDPSLLQANNATVAENVRLDRGSLYSLKKPKFYRESRKPRDQLTLYRFAPVPDDPDSGWMFSWDRVVDVAPGPVAGNRQHLTYWTGEDYPRYTDNSIGTSEEGPLPTGSYRLGVEAPEYGPHLELIFQEPPEPPEPVPPDPDKTDDDDDDELPESEDASTEVDRDYVVTFLQQLGSLVMEGPPSEPSKIVTVPSSPKGFGVKVTNIADPPSGPYPWHGKRLYRRIYSAGLTQFALVAELGLDQSEFEDYTPDAEIPGDQLVSQNYDPPPETMHSLGVLSNGLMFGANEYDVCISEPYLPHAWNPFARYPLPHPIVGMGQADNQIVAITAKNPYMVVGFSPSNMNTVELHLGQGCLSKRSIISGSFGCCYASPDGMVLISGQGSRIITAGLLTREQWQDLNPASMISATDEDLLVVTYTRADGSHGTMFMDPASPEMGIRFTDQYFLSAYHDGLLNGLLVWEPNEQAICLWDEGDLLPYTWRSKLHVLPMPLCMTAARVEADSYDNLTFRLYIDDALKYQVPVVGSDGFRLPSGYQSRLMRVELIGTDVVRSLCIAEAPHELE